MTGSVMIDVSIGLVLMYLIVALFCTTIQEWIAQVFSWRAKNLEATIIHLLNDGQLDGKATLDNASEQAKKVLAHPLVKMLAPGSKAGIRTGGQIPSYVPATNFALALIDVLKPVPASATTPFDFQGLRDAIETLKPTGSGAGNAELYKSLTAILDGVDQNITAAVEGIENWFNAAMDRASGWYKRNVQWWLLGIGLVLAVACNADSLQVLMRLSADANLRATVAAMAALANQGQEEIKVKLAAEAAHGDLMSAFGALPVGWGTCRASATDTSQPGAAPQSHFSLVACYPAQQLSQLEAVLLKILGLAVTALAASLGAPFWFGLLQQLNAIRSTGPKPASTSAN
jgi:hypothetical protein